MRKSAKIAIIGAGVVGAATFAVGVIRTLRSEGKKPRLSDLGIEGCTNEMPFVQSSVTTRADEGEKPTVLKDEADIVGV